MKRSFIGDTVTRRKSEDGFRENYVQAIYIIDNMSHAIGDVFIKSLFMEFKNAVSAGIHDPRFPSVREDELQQLVYSVDVLGETSPIKGPEELDVKRYGVIVSKGRKRGLLLPNLDGVDTVEQQIGIARQKAGIGPDEKGVSLERFEVIRHGDKG